MLWFVRAPTAERRGNHAGARAMNLPFWIQKLGDLDLGADRQSPRGRRMTSRKATEGEDFLLPLVSSPVSYFTKSISR